MLRRRVEAFLANAETPGSMLDLVREPTTGRFMAPVGSPLQEEQLEAFYGIPQDIPESAQDRDLGQRMAELATAVFDTGLLQSHPLLRGRIREQHDLTGEGPEDYHGHGTVVALILGTIAAGPAVRFWPLINVKVCNHNAKGTPAALIKGLEWIREYKLAHPELSISANLCVGVYSRRWLLWRCRGSCRVCKAAKRAADAGVAIIAAAGNAPGKTACPATVSAARGHDRIWSVAAPDIPTSGKGVLEASGKVPVFAPVD